jgi:hypothetical protein
MIVATDYEELIFNCQDYLTKDYTRILGELVNTINTNSSYAALTVMALYTAAMAIAFPIEELDNLVKMAEDSCHPLKVDEYKRFFHKFQDFEKNKDKIHLSENNFFVPASPSIH